MNKKKIISAVLACAMLPLGAMPLGASAQTDSVVVQLNPADASPFNNGEFQGWGTALCWWANRVGYSDKLTQAAAKAFFSDEGLGLDIARYNLGGGDNPDHNHITRSDSKVPGVYSAYTLSEDGKDVESITYDITKDQNQLNVAKAALAANPNLYFEGFSNSAPYFMTVTGCTSGGGTVNSDGSVTADANLNNLKDDMYDDFAKFIADATKLFKEEGIEFKSYSPMNEPDTNYWGYGSPKQEGCHFDPGTSQSKMIIETRKALDEAGLTDVLVAGMDETSLKKTANNLGSLTDEAKTALGRIDTHTYSDRDYHAKVKEKAQELGKNLWQSEVDKGGDGNTLASMIIEDMNGMQPSAWVMWDIVDFHKDSKFTAPDGTKPEANNSVTDTSSLWGVGMADHDNEELILTNKYYAYGQFTKYIQPGMTIIASSSNTLAAYDKKTGDIAIVALNNDSADKNVTFDLRAFSKTGTKATGTRTSNTEKWQSIADADVTDKQFTTTLKGKSVTSYLIEGDDTPVDYMTINGSTTIVTGTNFAYTVGASSFDLSEGSVTWSVSDSDIAEVTTNTDNSATVKAKKGGSFTLTATSGDVSTAIDVKVLDDSQTINILNKKSGLGLETKSKGITSGTQLVQWENRGIDTAAWKLKATDDGHFNIINVNADMLLAANSAGKPVISNTVLATDSAAKWDLVNHGGYYEIKNVSLEKSLNVSGQSTANGGNVILYAFGGGDNELWSISEIEGDLEHVVPVVVDYSEKYKGTKYTFVSNVDEGTNDFSDEAKGFVFTGFAGLGSDDDGEAVLLPQNSLSNTSNTQRAGTATLTLDTPIVCEESQMINLSFDMFTPNSNGNSDFALSSSDGKNIVSIKGNNWGKTYTVTIGDTDVETAGDGQTYFKNNVSDKVNPSYIKNGGHVEIYYTPSTGEVSVAIKNVTGTAAVKTYTGTTEAENIGKIYFAGTYTQWNKTMVVDNLITNIIVANISENEVKMTGTSGNTLNVTYAFAEAPDSAVLIGVLFNDDDTVKAIKVKDVISKEAGKKIEDSITFDEGINTSEYKAKVMVWNKLTGENAMKPLCVGKSKEAEPKATDAPVIPDSGELISLNFDNGDLTSTSTYGKASGTPVFAEADGKKCIQLDGTSATAVTLTDANGNPLLTGQKNITISFNVKPTSTATSWWFFAAPDDNAQTYLSEKYLGAMGASGKMTVERYNNSGARSAAATGTYKTNEWNSVVIAVEDGVTSLYINGVKTQETSTVDISDMLGKNSVAYIGKANWDSGEFATGYIDDFVIETGVTIPSVTLGDLSAVESNLTLPAVADDKTSAVAWTSSNTDVIANDGTVTIPEETTNVTLTAKITKGDKMFTQTFNATVIGSLSAADSFAAYAEENDGVKSIKYTSDYDSEKSPYTVKVTLTNSENAEQTSETGSGSFDNVQNGTYTISFSLLKDGEVKKTVTRTVQVKDVLDTQAYLFVHFVGTESTADEEQIYFSVSQNGTDWTTLNDGKPVLTSNVGEKGVRDPHILRGEDGKFFIIATDLSIYNRRDDSNRWGTCQTSGSKSIVVWESDDLVNWSDANLVEVAPSNAGCTWAPESVYDAEKGEYMVFWASKTADDNYATQRIYRSYTKDFKTFSEPELYIDGGNVSNIDTTITDYKGMYYRFTKNESNSSVTMMKSGSLSGDWTDVASYTLGTMTGYEGPTIYKVNGENKWCLLLDYYSKSQGYKPFVTDDIEKGSFTAGSNFNFDVKYRHGTVMPITKAEYDKLTSAAE